MVRQTSAITAHPRPLVNSTTIANQPKATRSKRKTKASEGNESISVSLDSSGGKKSEQSGKSSRKKQGLQDTSKARKRPKQKGTSDGATSMPRGPASIAQTGNSAPTNTSVEHVKAMEEELAQLKEALALATSQSTTVDDNIKPNSLFKPVHFKKNSSPSRLMGLDQSIPEEKAIYQSCKHAVWRAAGAAQVDLQTTRFSEIKNTKQLADICSGARALEPYLCRYAQDWAIAYMLQQTMSGRNSYRNAMGRVGSGVYNRRVRTTAIGYEQEQQRREEEGLTPLQGSDDEDRDKSPDGSELADEIRNTYPNTGSTSTAFSGSAGNADNLDDAATGLVPAIFRNKKRKAHQEGGNLSSRCALKKQRVNFNAHVNGEEPEARETDTEGEESSEEEQDYDAEDGSDSGIEMEEELDDSIENEQDAVNVA